ncbi:hypothetical protein RB200_29055 [Streptomyces sp. PmtG]
MPGNSIMKKAQQMLGCDSAAAKAQPKQPDRVAKSTAKQGGATA